MARLDVLLDFIAPRLAEDAIQHDAVAVDVERGGQIVDAAVLVGDLLLADEDGIVDGVFGGELHHILRVAIIHGDADDLQSLAAVALLQLDEPGNLLLAGRAPGGPEVEHHGLAAQIAELHGVSLEIGEHEVRRVVAGALTAAAALPAPPGRVMRAASRYLASSSRPATTTTISAKTTMLRFKPNTPLLVEMRYREKRFRKPR